MLLQNNGKLSSNNQTSNQTKHINIFIKDYSDQKEIKIYFCGTDEMWANFYTKPVQGEKFKEFVKIILNLEN